MLPADVYEYMLKCSSREHPVMRRLRETMAKHEESNMQISPEVAQFLGFVVKLIGAKRCIELGTFMGYSALAVALALPPTGKLIACDVSEEFAKIARSFWREAGVESRIDLRLQPALKSLDEILATEGPNSFDFAFNDADKTNYTAYYEKLLQLIRPGGLIAVDNTLAASVWVIHEDQCEWVEDLRAARTFNDHVHNDDRVDLAMVTIGEGVTLLRKR